MDVNVAAPALGATGCMHRLQKSHAGHEDVAACAIDAMRLNAARCATSNTDAPRRDCREVQKLQRVRANFARASRRVGA